MTNNLSLVKLKELTDAMASHDRQCTVCQNDVTKLEGRIRELEKELEKVNGSNGSNKQ